MESRRDSKEGGKYGIESGQDKEKSNHSAESRRGSKERISNGNDVMSRRDCKERGVHTTETLPWCEAKDRSNYNTESPKVQDRDTRSGSSAMASSSRSGWSSMSPNLMLGNSNSGKFWALLVSWCCWGTKFCTALDLLAWCSAVISARLAKKYLADLRCFFSGVKRQRWWSASQ